MMDVYRRIGGLEIGLSVRAAAIAVYRRIGGLEIWEV